MDRSIDLNKGVFAPFCELISNDLYMVAQAAVLKCLSYNQLPFLQDLFGSPEVRHCRCDVAKALVVALIVEITGGISVEDAAVRASTRTIEVSWIGWCSLGKTLHFQRLCLIA